jgi:hypothetical protein
MLASIAQLGEDEARTSGGHSSRWNVAQSGCGRRSGTVGGSVSGGRRAQPEAGRHLRLSMAAGILRTDNLGLASGFVQGLAVHTIQRNRFAS